MTCFEMKIASALLKWFLMSSHTQQPGLTGSALPKQATKEQWVCALSILILAVSCRGRCYSIESISDEDREDEKGRGEKTDSASD